ncbi:MAG: 50S ribosomal protein L11 methyltransferase [Actinomycetota bacterium]|nr:50S ribosomal protein L11 methyltransferase [Actinomycetota bacterium]
MIRLAIRVRHAQAELVLAELLELAPAGVEEVEVAEETIEFAVYGAPGELPSLPDLTAAAGDALVEISTSQTADDWQERWRQFHRPVLIQAPAAQQRGGARVPALRIRPPWEPPDERGDWPAEEIVIEPGQAFGTGAHASTRMCLELLLALAASERPSGAVLDIGTGSGVLAIAAARVGFQPVLALDHERESVQAARANAATNGVRLGVRRFDLRRQTLPWLGEAGVAAKRPVVVLANLLGPLLLELARTMPSAPAHMLAGGLLTGQVRETARAFGDRLGLRVREQRQSGEWAALWLSADEADSGTSDQADSGTSVAARTIER